MPASMQFFHFNLMPYPHIPPGPEIESVWVTLSNGHYDPIRGHELYRQYIEQAVLAERLGFDGTCVNEHHQSAYGTICDPNVMASHIVAKTERIKIGILGNALPLHANPLRVAESVALLDVMSGGRIISGFVRGIGMEYHSSRSDPTTSRERFWEAHDLIVRAWTEDGPFYWDGKHYTFPYVNPWPRPFQKPHPPIWLPGLGSAETIEEAARRRYPFMMVFAPLAFTKVNYDMYREAAAAAGYTPTPDQLAFCVPVHTAETDAKAHAEAREHFEWLFHTALKTPAWQVLPPGYVSSRSLRGMLAGRARFGMKDFADISYQEMVDQQYIIVGSPDTVADRLSVYSEELGAGVHIGGGMAIGSMPHELVLQSMHLFAEVMPRFRGEPAAAAAPPVLPDGGEAATVAGAESPVPTAHG